MEGPFDFGQWMHACNDVHHWLLLSSQPKTYLVGTQKSCLNETVFMGIQNICID